MVARMCGLVLLCWLGCSLIVVADEPVSGQFHYGTAGGQIKDVMACHIDFDDEDAVVVFLPSRKISFRHTMRVAADGFGLDFGDPQFGSPWIQIFIAEDTGKLLAISAFDGKKRLDIRDPAELRNVKGQLQSRDDGRIVGSLKGIFDKSSFDFDVSITADTEAPVVDYTDWPKRQPKRAAKQPALKVETITSEFSRMTLVKVPAGKFKMGTSPRERRRQNAEGPEHEVTISRPFYLGAYEVTEAEYKNVTKYHPRYSADDPEKPARIDFPEANASWYDAVEFCNLLSQKDGLPEMYKIDKATRDQGRIVSAKVTQRMGIGYRLPTEAEWEYACRANTETAFSWGKTMNGDEGNIDGKSPYGTKTQGGSLGATTRQGDYGPNPFGLYDMHGNVMEWCADSYDEDAYQRRAVFIDPIVWLSGYGQRVVRGGSWQHGGVVARSGWRDGQEPTNYLWDFGFRIARDVSEIKENGGH